MKCVCGYEYNRDPMDMDGMHLGGVQFVQLSGHGIKYKDNYERPCSHYSTVAADLFACPKCGTVRVEL